MCLLNLVLFTCHYCYFNWLYRAVDNRWWQRLRIPMIDDIFTQTTRVNYFTTAEKSTLKLIELQSFEAKCCKQLQITENIALRSLHLYYARKILSLSPQSGSDAVRFPCVIISQTSQGYIFRYLQRFATKLKGALFNCSERFCSHCLQSKFTVYHWNCCMLFTEECSVLVVANFHQF